MASFFLDTQARVIDANTTTAEIWSVGSYISGTIQVVAEGLVPWTNAVVTIKRSNNGVNFDGMPTAVTLSADGTTPVLDLTGVPFVSIEVTTVNGSALTLNAWACFKTA